mmetsp:Transcript_15947/g.19785  ORF Transcript_15947/g.19785 Transcript_15947/m.19785 type:complete len:293 (-) Transcript_15947:1345-2223(-)
MSGSPLASATSRRVLMSGLRSKWKLNLIIDHSKHSSLKKKYSSISIDSPLRGRKLFSGLNGICCCSHSLQLFDTASNRALFGQRSRFHTKPEIECWNCSSTIADFGLFCDTCDAIRDPSQMNDYDYFKLLGLPKEFGLNVKEMEKIFWKVQMNLHPDKFTQSSDKEKEYSADLSSKVNHAYNVLKSPVRRAQYLLEMHGIDALSEGGETNTDPALLMEAMEAREELEETESIKDLKSMKKNFASTIAKVEGELKASFDAHKLEEAARLAVRLRYLTKVVDEIDEKLLLLDTS